MGGDDGIVVVDRATLDILGTVHSAGILGAGHHIATDSQGNLYVAATGAGMQKLTFRGMSGHGNSALTRPRWSGAGLRRVEHGRHVRGESLQKP